MTKGEEHDGHQVNGVTFVPKDNTLLYHKGSGCLMARNLETDQERQIAASCRGTYTFHSHFSLFNPSK